MQDRFKFRTYHPDLKSFTYWGWINDGEYKNMCSCREISKDELLEKYTNQCTGLKDKNSELIYEGDILGITYTFDGGIGHEFLKVVWDDLKCAFGFESTKGCKEYPFEYFEPNENEIIGNVYKNPELLEKK